MRSDRFRSFTKRGAALGVAAVLAGGIALLVAAALIAGLLVLVF